MMLRQQPSCAVVQGFFQPIAGEPYKHSSTGLPRQVELLHTAFSLADDPAAMAGISRCAPDRTKSSRLSDLELVWSADHAAAPEDAVFCDTGRLSAGLTLNTSCGWRLQL